MKYDDFKIFKFSTILKIIDFRRYNFSKIYKRINFKRYKYILIYLTDFVVSTIKYVFSGVYKRSNFKRYNFSKIYRYLDFRRYNFSKIYRYFDIKKYKNVPVYFVGIVVFSSLIYLSIPMFFNYDKSKLENTLCKDINLKCLIDGKIRYSFFPSPRIKIKNLVIQNTENKNISFGKIENVTVKLSILNLIDKRKFNFTKIEFKNAIINFDAENLKNLKKFSKRKFSSLPLSLTNGEIKFFEEDKYISKIENVSFKYKNGKDKFRAELKGEFLNDNIFVSYENEKKEKNFKNTIIIKFDNLNLFSKMEIFNLFSKNGTNGNILLKKDKNKITGIFDYNDNQMTFKHANLNSIFLDGKLTGNLKFSPYFSFDLDVNLNNINFSRIYNSLVNLDEEIKKNLFRVNSQINGKLSLSTDKIISKKSFIKSFESRLKFINGNISIEQFLFNLGKLGAADLIGTINNDKKFSNLKFESNIFIDNLKKFYNKFNIYNKPKTPYDLFISGNVNLINLVLRFDEISDNKKFSIEDINYFEKEFNELFLRNGYNTLFNYASLKEFIKLTGTEEN